MDAADCIALAALILLLLPVVILPWEGRRVPNLAYCALALGGLATAAVRGGAYGAVSAGMAGIAAIIAMAALATAIRKTTDVNVFTSGQLKLLGAGSVWLGWTGALAMLAATFATVLAIVALRRGRPAAARPDFALIASAAILLVSVQQALLADDAAPTLDGGPAAG